MRVRPSPDILQLVEDVARLVLDEDGSVGGLQHPHRELLGEHVDDEGVQGVHAADLMGDVDAPRLVPKLQEQDPWKQSTPMPCW